MGKTCLSEYLSDIKKIIFDMNNINGKLQSEKSTCLELQKEISFFDELISGIEMRQSLFKKFEEYLINKKVDSIFPDNNDFCRMILRGYLIQQLLDLAKFFDKDERVFSFRFVVRHSENFSKRYKKLFAMWQSYDLKNVRNKVFAHSQKNYTNLFVVRKNLDNFIKETISLFKDIIDDLEQRYLISSIHFHGNNSYLLDVANDVEKFFRALT